MTRKEHAQCANEYLAAQYFGVYVGEIEILHETDSLLRFRLSKQLDYTATKYTTGKMHGKISKKSIRPA